MSNPKKPADRRQRRNSNDIGLVSLPGRISEVPEPSKPWLATTKTRWETFWASKVAQVTELDSDLPAVTRLFDYYDDMERSLKALRDTRFVEGSKGQPRLNPIASHIGRLEGQIVALEDRFGLTPKARLQLGISFADAARSLDELNRSYQDDGEQEEADPRDFQVIEGEASA